MNPISQNAKTALLAVGTAATYVALGPAGLGYKLGARIGYTLLGSLLIDTGRAHVPTTVTTTAGVTSLVAGATPATLSPWAKIKALL
jgi:hypothetical protein